MAVFRITLVLIAATLIAACNGDTARNLTGINNNEPVPTGEGDAAGPQAEAGSGSSSEGPGSDGEGPGSGSDGSSSSGETSACKDGDTRWCSAGLGACREGEQTCAAASWGPCVPKNMGGPEICDGDDNDCDGAVDEGCECVDGSSRRCGVSFGPCERGTQSCKNGAWTDCEGGVQPAPETCDAVDNDCDGVADDGFNLNEPCSSQGLCPQSRRCSPDGRSTTCKTDRELFAAERCDGIDNDCDGLVDRVVDRGELRSVCTCSSEILAIGKATSFALDGDENLCATTACTSDKPRRVQVDATCYPICETDSDPDKDGWGYENGASCVVEDSMRGRAAKPCPNDPMPLGMSLSYCLDCSGVGNSPFAECQSMPRYDLTAFGRGDVWLEVEYSFISSGAALLPINLWFDAGEGRRKHLPLVRVGDLPVERAKRLLRAQDACFEPLDAFGSTCSQVAPTCPQCGPSERCGALDACGGYDLSDATLEVAAEFCPPGIGQQSGTVVVHQVELVEPRCVEGG